MMKRLLSFFLSAMMIAMGMVFTASADNTEITSLTTPPTKLWGLTADAVINAPEAVATETDAGVSITPVWAGADGFTFGTKAEGDTVIAYTATYTAPDGYIFAESFEEGENVTVSANGKTLTYKLYAYVIPKDAIYIDDLGTDSTDDYAEGNLARPYKTIDYAMSLLQAKGGGTIVVKDTVTMTKSRDSAKFSGDYTLVGYDAESTVKIAEKIEYYIPANMTIRDLNLAMECMDRGLYANGHNLTLGDKNYSDLIVTGDARSRQLFSFAYGVNFTDVNSKITINSGDFALFVGTGYGGGNVTGNVTYEINGGNISNFRAGLWGNAGYSNTFTGDIDFVMNGGTITTLLGTSANANYTHNGNLNMTINGGSITTLTPVNNKVSGDYYNCVNGDVTVKINDGTIGTIKNYPSVTVTSGDVDTVSGKTEIDILDYSGDKDALFKKITSSQFDVVKSKIIYVDSENGASGNDGLTPDTALPTMTAAFAKFAGGASGKIIICGEYATTSGFTDTAGRGEVVITGYDENSEIAFHGGFTLLGDTIFENIHFEVMASYKTIGAAGNKLVMGDGITVGNNGVTANRLQLAGVNAGAAINPAESVNMVINSGTYGTVSAVGTLYGGYVPGDVNVTINGGTFEGGLIIGSYCSAGSMTSGITADKTSKDNTGTIGGAINFTVNDGNFTSEVKIGGKQYGTIGSINAKINGGKFTSSVIFGPELASYDKDAENETKVTFGDGKEYSYTTDVLGDAILEISGGTFTGTIKHTGNVVNGKSVVVMTNGTTANVAPAGFDYVVSASRKGDVTYDATTDKFSIVPMNSVLDIFINDEPLTKTGDNTYTLSGGTDNVYNIVFGGESDIAESFIITAPVPGLTPVKEIVLPRDASTKKPSELVSSTAGKVTWEPAHTKFEYDTQYTATVVLTANDGVEYSDYFDKLVINGGYAKNIVECELSEDKTQVTVNVTFPKTPKYELDVLSESETPVSVSFTTGRTGELGAKETTITFENVNDGEKTVVTATENGTEGSYSGTLASGIYNVTVKKQGYLAETKEAVLISGTKTVSLDFGTLTGGDIVDGDGTTAGDGEINLKDFVIALRAFSDSEGGVVWNAADIDENGVPTVQDLSHIKTAFSKTLGETTDYNGYFENTYYRLTVDKELNVGYIGGSIIQGASGTGTRSYEAGNPVPAGNELFIDRMQANFEKHFPDAEIHSINAGVSDTGTAFGIFRLGSDMMLRDEGYIPDLVFLEFAVNDFGNLGEENIMIMYESIINEVYSINPKADIVCMITGMGGYDMQRRAHSTVAKHYDIPVADVGTALYTDYTVSGNFAVFTNDNLHPNGAGYEYYTKVCFDMIEKYIVKAAPSNPKYKDKVLPEELTGYVMENPVALAMDEAEITYGTENASGTHAWTSALSTNVYSRIFDKDVKKLPYIASTQKGDYFSFSFTGDALLFIIKQSPNMGSFEYKIDDGSWITMSSTKSYDHFQTYPINLKIEDGTHTVTVRVTGEPTSSSANPSASNYCEVGIAGIFYNETAAE